MKEDGASVPQDLVPQEEVEELPHIKATIKTSPTEHSRDPRTLFVRNLHPTTTSDDLTILFSHLFPIKHAVAVLDPATKQCKGFGFVTFTDEADSKQAITELNGSDLKGRKIKVEPAQVRHRGEDDDPNAPKIKKVTQEKVPGPKLIIRNLPWTIDTSDKLTHLFLAFGKVKEAILPKLPSGQLRGFGIVILRGKKNAENALRGLNGKEIEGRTLAVDWAADKETWEKSRQSEKKDKEVEAGEKQPKPLTEDAESDDDSEGGVKLDSLVIDSDNDVLDEEAEAEDDDGDVDMESLNSDVDAEGDEEDAVTKRPDNTDSTIFIRNLPFTCEDDDLTEHFEQFGAVRYSRIVYDQTIGKPRGTGFVCFYNKTDADQCIREAPHSTTQKTNGPHNQTVLQDYANDPTGKYTIDGRVLIITRAVKKEEASKLNQEGINYRSDRDKDKRRLYLLREGRIPTNHPLFSKLPQSEIKLRDASVQQRKKLVEGNPSLHLSLTRLAIRNIPKFMSSKDLKALAREAVVGFAIDVKGGIRQSLSKEELARGGDEMKEADRARRVSGKGIVKQAKIVFETKEGSKIPESDGAGKSRGYGFIEYYTHRSALMGLRWLNGHEIVAKVANKSKKQQPVDAEDKKKRLIVEFALENVNVVNRRRDRESKTFEKGSDMKKGKFQKKGTADESETPKEPEVIDPKKEEIANRSRIIQKKRMARRNRKNGAA